MVRILAFISAFFLTLMFVGLLAGGYVVWRLNQDLPDYSKLANYEPPVVTRVHAADGRLIGEYAEQRRLYVPIDVIPRRVIHAFLSAEDKNFYSHGGVDAKGIVRAVFDNVLNVIRGRRLVGASTITQQVAKNFLLTNEVSFNRKIKEALLAIKLEHAYTKDQILELYLNEIYLGAGSYGVAAAALNYFDKSLDDLTVAEAAYLATLPKGPANYHPYRHHDRAVARRNWVIGRMEEDGYITPEVEKEAQATDLVVDMRDAGVQIADASYFVEQVRRELVDRYGNDKLLKGGLSVRTTIDTGLQKIVTDELRQGLEAYDRRHGWRGPLKKLEPEANWRNELTGTDLPDDLKPWTLAVVLGVEPGKAQIGIRPRRLPSGKFAEETPKGTIPLSEMTWARKTVGKVYLGPEVKKAGDVLEVGDVVYVEPVDKDGKSVAGDAEPDHYALRQVPAVNGAAIAMDPHTGRILAMQGGFSYDLSEFNRAVQAMRQPGSSFKPFVYAAALDSGFTPASLVLDAPFVLDPGPGQELWKPQNYEHNFRGPSTLRYGLVHSRNVMTVRLAQYVGMDKVAAYAEKFGVMDDMMPVLSMALGAGDTTLLRMTSAYAILDNGGKKVVPTLIDRVQDRRGRTIYKHDERACPDCDEPWEPGMQPPELPDDRPQVENPQTAYQITSLLEGVVQNGTGSAARKVKKPLAGKTGTTSEERDAWFMGYSPNLVVGVYVGFDDPIPMGRAETGGRVAAPIFADIMQRALADKPAIPFRIPPGINFVKIDGDTGKLAGPGTQHVVLEAFKTGTAPKAGNDNGGQPDVIGGLGQRKDDTGTEAPSGSYYGDGSVGAGTGGLY